MIRNPPAWITASVGIVAIIWILPIVGIVVTSLRPPADVVLGWWRLDEVHITFNAWIQVWSKYPLAGAFWVSVETAGIATIITVLLAPMAAYAFHYLNFPLRRTLLIIVVNAFVLPQQVIIIPLFMLWRDVGLLDNVIGVIIPYVGASFAWSIFLVKNFLEDFPKELIEAAKIDRCGPVRTFFAVVLPNLGTPIAAVAILQFLWCWNSLLLPVIFLRTNIPLPQLLTRISGTYESNWDQRSVAAIITTIVPLIVFIIFQRQFTAGSYTKTGTKE